MMKKFATIKEAAEATGLSPRALRVYIASGKIRDCRKIGKHILIPVEQIERIGKPLATAQSLRGSAA